MLKKAALIILFFCVLTLLQNSFLAHFSFWGFVPNYVLLSVIFIILFERSGGKLGLFAAVTGGLLSDIFSYGSLFFGFYFGLFLLIWFLIRLLLRKYVQVPSIRKI